MKGFARKELERRLEGFFIKYISLTKENWSLFVRTFPLAHKTFDLVDNPALGPVLKKLMGSLQPADDHTQCHLLPINRNIEYRAGKPDTPAPFDMVSRLIEESGYRAIMNSCMCRDGTKCRDYPTDIGCILLGDSTRAAVKRGFAREASVEEALAHLERAADLGLVAIPAWVKMEATLMGMTVDEHERYMEICLCCPCCCVGLRNVKSIMQVPGLQERFGSVGWLAVVAEDCSACGACAAVCPAGAIVIGEGKIEVDERCIGCGLCAVHCPEEAIYMQEGEKPIKGHLLDYFEGTRPLIKG